MSTDIATAGEPGKTGHGATVVMALGAIGIVYGDIGTSPIYALRETVRAAAGDSAPSRSDIIGALSIIIWALTVVVTLKYALLVLRADNKGEGGTLSIMALARTVLPKRATLIAMIGMAGASLFFGDAVITPAISVLSAVEGLHVAAPSISSYVVPITVVIIITLFAAQRFGTGRVSSVFGPITLIWFLTLGISGAVHLLDDPSVFGAINPYHAVRFLLDHSGVAMAVIGASFLAVTGAEALYVDLGHFGRPPILLAWFSVVFPCLLLNYFGQGAWLLKNGAVVDQPLFQMMPDAALIPVVILATMATVIASQAVISGAFSLTRQAAQLHLLPRFDVVHTSETQSGQIYLPGLNWMLMVGVLLLVIGFGSSESLAAAYGISVTGEMLITTLLLAVVALGIWRWNWVVAAAVITPFAIVEVVFLSANLTKIPDGGWVSIAIALCVFAIMHTWVRGSQFLFDKTRKMEVPLETLVRQLDTPDRQFVPGTAIFLTGDADYAPTSLMHSLKHYKALHDNNIVLMVETAPQPRVPPSERATIETIAPWMTRLVLRFGYMEDPNVLRALGECRKRQELKFDIMSTSFFLSRRSLIASARKGMPKWQDKIFIQLARNAADATSYFRLPTDRVVELGTQVVI